MMFAVGLIVASVGLASVQVYHQTRSTLEAHLSEQLLSIVRSAAPLVDGDLHQLVSGGPDGAPRQRDEFEELRSQMVKVQTANGLSGHGSPVYTFRKAADFKRTHELEFVIMTTPDEHGHWFVGNRYRATPHLLQALAGVPAATHVYHDTEGDWISAAAPIRDSHGTIVGVLQADHHAEYFESEARRQALLILLIAMASIIAGGALAYVLARNLVRPIRTLMVANRALGTGQFSARIHESRSDEFGELFLTFNHMAEYLEVQTKALVVARTEAEAGSRAKSEFLATMSHELRTPLNGVLGMTELLLGSQLDEDQREDAQVVKQSALALLAILNDVLDFSKTESGRIELEAVPVDVRKLCHEVLMLFSSTIAQKPVTLTGDIAAETPLQVEGDPGRLRQVLANLVGNALKFTEKGAVQLCVLPRADGLRFEIRDTGIGMDDSVRARLFQPFTQADGTFTRRFGGTGLGLAICKRFVEMMQGSIEVTSEPGAGSTFAFEVPLRTLVAAPAPEITPAPAAVSSHGAIPAPTASPLAALLPLPVDPPAQAPVPDGVLAVLVVEDLELNRRIVVKMLEKIGCKVAIAEDGSKAVEQWRRQRFDLIFMDCMMPVMDGFQATERIRELEGAGPRTPIVALTANAMPQDREHCLAVGMDDHVAKPVRSELLRGVLLQFCATHPVVEGLRAA